MSAVSRDERASDLVRPTIPIEPGDLPGAADQGQQALIDAVANIFQRGGGLVTIASGGPDDRVRREPKAPRLVSVTAVHLREQLTRHAGWEKYSAKVKDWVKVDCPMAVADALAARGSWQFRELVGIIHAPTLREDGSLLRAPGHDAVSGLYLMPVDSALLRTTPRLVDLGREKAMASADTLMKALASFPFVAPADHVAAVAMILTALVARSIAAVPMAVVTAPTPGTGKSLLADVPAILATGRRAAVMSIGRDASEAEKRLGGAMLSGDLIIHLDNVERPLEGDLLCQLITQPEIIIRPLGGSAMLRIPARSFLIATGNNLTVRGDLNRRVMQIRLDAGMERPETRTFERDLLEDIRADRANLVRAALTISLAYNTAGCPPIPGHTPYGSFDAWDRLVRRPLMWLGLDDPLAPAEALRDDDPDRAGMRALFSALRETYRDQVVTAATIAEDAARAAPRFDGGGRDHDHPDLHDALEQVAGANANARQIGYALRRYRGRMVDGLVLEAAGPTGRAKVTGWRIRSLSSSPYAGDRGDNG